MTKVEKYFRMAKLVALRGDAKDAQRQYRIGAVGIRNDGVIVGASNVPSRKQIVNAHAEYRTAKMLTIDSIMFVVRISRSGNLRLAKPCEKCQKYLKFRKVRKCYYSIDNENYGVMQF